MFGSGDYCMSVEQRRGSYSRENTRASLVFFAIPMNTSVGIPQTRPPALYYLHNFLTALRWLRERYADLLSDSENSFIAEFTTLPRSSQALLVRLIMRKAQFFRASKISYPEIESVERAVGPLITLQWVDPRPLLGLADLFRLSRRAEIREMFPELPRGIAKAEWLERLQGSHVESRSFEEWRGSVRRAGLFRDCGADLHAPQTLVLRQFQTRLVGIRAGRSWNLQI